MKCVRVAILGVCLVGACFGNELKFDEMYQKAFGAEVSEKRKERLKNEEKFFEIKNKILVPNYY